jgi:hypothetical protein
LLKLEKVSIQTDSATLRKIAEFINKTADLMDKHGKAFGHEHYQDNVDNPPEGADIIIVRAQ